MKKRLIIVLLFVLLALAMVLVLSPGRTSAGTASASPAPTASPTSSPAPTVTPVASASPTPSPSPTPEPEPEAFVISLVGDCTIGSSQHSRGNSSSYEGVVGEDYAFPFAETATIFQQDYLSIANMEGTFTTSDASSGATFTFKADPAYARVFSSGGIDLVVLGNNHSSDYGAQGRSDTEAALEAVGVSYAEDRSWCVFSREDGIRIGVYSRLYPSTADVQSGVAAIQAEGADVIIAALHWGVEGSYRPTAEQTIVGHAAIDAGADIVYGSHPHVLQKCEAYGDGFIFYSLGNWSFGGNTNPRDRDTAIVQLTVLRSPEGEISLSAVDYIPCCLSSAPAGNNYQPIPYAVGSPEYERAMSKLDGSFNGPDLTIDYSAFHKPEESPAPTGEGTADAGASGEGTPGESVPGESTPGESTSGESGTSGSTEGIPDAAAPVAPVATVDPASIPAA